MKVSYLFKVAAGLLLSIVLMSSLGCITSSPKPGTPDIKVVEQDVANADVEIDYAVSDGPGFLALYADGYDKPGALLGFAPLKDGINWDVHIKIDGINKTNYLWAILHSDRGEMGKFDPATDPQVMANDRMVARVFNADSTLLGPKATHEPGALPGTY